MSAPALELLDIHKRFGSVQALRGAELTLAPGEVHALLGENGAGKTTLMHVAYGLVAPDGGEIRVAGVPVRIGSPRRARELGIGMVHQHFTSVPALSVAENVALAAGWRVTPGPLRQRVEELCERVGLPLPPERRAGDLGVALRQRLEIVKALAAEARVLLLDEPTAVLAPQEADELFRVVRRFAMSGGAAVLITHKLDEALASADRLTVLRRGAVVAGGPVSAFDRAGLARLMVGSDARPKSDAAAAAPFTPGSMTEGAPVRVLARDLDVAREGGYGLAVRHVSLEVRAGDIVGVAAVEGNGQRELLRAVAGRLTPLRGRLETATPVGFIPEDRTTEGLIPRLTLAENVALGSGPLDPWVKGPVMDWPHLRARTAALLEEFDVTPRAPEAMAGALSGGNQQRVVVARELARAPRVIVAENPTRGLDIRAAAEIQARLRRAAEEGAAVLLHSGDLDEVLELATRVVVVARGTLREVPRGTSRAQVGAAMLAAD